MTLAIFIVIAAVLALFLILRVAVSRRLQLSQGETLVRQLQTVDVEAFRNLVNPSDDEYLRLRLSAAQFRVVRRARLRAMSAYVKDAGKNAALLVRIGQIALSSHDPRTEIAAQELVNSALMLRRNATLALFRIYVALAWPYAELGTGRIIDGYVQLSGSAMLLGRLQNPTSPVRL
jgi:hypothetical protein